MRHVQLLVLAIGVFLVLPLAAARAGDWPQYRGPNTDGISTEKADLKWPAEGPKVLWKVPTQNGFSSFAVSGGKAFTQVNRAVGGEQREVCLALDAAKGAELWATEVGPGKYDQGGDTGASGNNGGDGPRSTPAASDGKVYVFTQHLVLYCLDAATGKADWTKDLVKEFAGRNIGWKAAASPVADGDLVLVAGGGAGQSILAFNKKTGDVAWKSQDEVATHATPVVATILGERQAIFFMKSGLVAVAVKDGKLLWKLPFKFNVSTAASAVVAGDVVYCSAGYDVGSAACKITKEGDAFAAKQLWMIPGNKPIANHWSTPVYKDGHLYGMFSFKQFGSGPMKCVELATGKVLWEQPGFGPGNVILVGDKILALSDDGQVVVVEASPAAYKETARFKAVAGKCWSTPAFSDGRIYVRSTKEGTCLDVSGK